MEGVDKAIIIIRSHQLLHKAGIGEGELEDLWRAGDIISVSDKALRRALFGQ